MRIKKNIKKNFVRMVYLKRYPYKKFVWDLIWIHFDSPPKKMMVIDWEIYEDIDGKIEKFMKI